MFAGIVFALLGATQGLAEEAAAPQPSLKETTGRVGKSIVRLAAYSGSGEKGHGTGFLVRSDGVVTTNFHVVEHVRDSEFFAVFSDGTKKRVLGSLALDEEHDLALVRIEGSGYPVLELAPDDSLAVGQQVFLVGSSHGLDQSLGIGVVSALRDDLPQAMREREERAGRRVTRGPLVQHTATAAPGASGSAIMDMQGRVVAVHHSGWSDTEINMGAHVSLLRALLARTDLAAPPVPFGRSVGTNLAISGGLVMAVGLIVLVWRAVGRTRAGTKNPRLQM